MDISEVGKKVGQLGDVEKKVEQLNEQTSGLLEKAGEALKPVNADAAQKLEDLGEKIHDMDLKTLGKKPEGK